MRQECSWNNSGLSGKNYTQIKGLTTVNQTFPVTLRKSQQPYLQDIQAEQLYIRFVRWPVRNAG